MGLPVNYPQTESRESPQTARVLEVIGPAGAGKTTLFEGLGKYPERIQLSNFPNVRNKKDAPFFIRYGLQLIPKILRLYRRGSRPLKRREFAWLSIMMGWPNVLKTEEKKSSRLIVLDQGPVYLVGEMKEFGPEFLRAPAAEGFWQDLYRRWAAIVDMIVWLDAADAVLLERIRSRQQDHVVKDATDSTMIEFLEQYRRIYDFTVSKLMACNPGLRVLRFDTGKQTARDIIDHLRPEIEPA